MAAVGHQRAGKGSRWDVGSGPTHMRGGEWKCTRKADDLDTTNFESAGEDQGTTGIASTDWDASGNWDAQQNMFDTPALFPTDAGGPLKFYTSLSDNIFWLITTARILSSGNGAQVKGLVTFQCSGKSNGGVTLPTGSV